MEKLFIGIDFSKEKVDVAIIFADGLTETEPRVFGEFKNSVSGYKGLAKWVEKNAKDIDPSQWLFCGENTGDYSKGLCNHLYGKGYDMWLENAKSIKDASGLRRMKSDRADASMIAEYAMRHYDKAVMYEPLSESLMQLREYFLYRQKLVKSRCSYQVRREEKRLTMEKCHARTSISRSEQIIVNQLNKQIERIDKEMQDLIEGDEELMSVFTIATSAPGIGPQNAICLMVYTDNFRRFNYNARKIACYYGLAPFGKDSGTSVHSDPHVHPMANRQIKAMLTQAALAAVRFNPKLGIYYQRLIDQGKKPQVALNNVKNKLIHLVTAMVRNRKVYDPHYRISS